MAGANLRRAGFLKREKIKRHNSAWAKDDAWKDTRGGFNPDVFKDVDDATRQRLRDHQVGPAVLKGDKVRGLAGALSIGAWGDGVHGEAGPMHKFNWGGTDAGVKRAHNRGNVQDAVWETGLSGIENKEQLNQFLDRADAVKAKHGDFLKDGWTPEAIMMMRDKPQQKQAPAPAPAPVTKQPEAKPNVGPAEDSDHLKNAKELAQNWQKNAQNTQTQPTAEKTSYDKRRFTQEKKQYDFTNSNIDGDTKNV